ncbi:unnamed protein product [Fusarium venenatum]|uniref:Uncharacterized protein n=1 Tax=Fusarium venenatum TaxID=56646 RepID=A0A2L2SPS7_9HYPO|nr:uncharacterized protein FVRRES_11461 [Fusarium venenatum]CEI38770.1 unnamed protein product [Fusarium venenatum]
MTYANRDRALDQILLYRDRQYLSGFWLVAEVSLTYSRRLHRLYLYDLTETQSTDADDNKSERYTNIQSFCICIYRIMGGAKYHT